MGHCMFLRKGEMHTVPLSGILASDIAVGSTVKLMENGTAVDYLVVNQGLPSSMYDASCDGMWVLRKDIYENRQWHSSNSNSYKASTIHSYLNSTFLGLFDSGIQAAIKEVKIPYVNGTGKSAVASGANGLDANIFLLSGYEIGFTTSVWSAFPVDGAKLDYFLSGKSDTENSKRIANLNGNPIRWWSRSPRTDSSSSSCGADSDGSYYGTNCTTAYGIRPALILPSTALFDKTTLILKGVA